MTDRPNQKLDRPTELLRTAPEPDGDRTLTAIVRGTREQLDQVATLTGTAPELLELADDGSGYAWHDSGPQILAEIARHVKGQPLDWESLDQQEQAAVVLTAAYSGQWSQGNLDPYQVDELLLEYPGLAERFQAG